MKIVEVNNPGAESIFYTLPQKMYKNDRNWILHLGKDIEAIFHPEKNSSFKNGEAKRWILLNDYNMPSGRIAAFYNKGNSAKAGIGFFECSNNESEAFLLFDTAKAWLKENGFNQIEGPINFGEKDKFWGLLTGGFEYPLYLDNYNFPYYENLFLRYGFHEASKIYTYKLLLKGVPVEKLERITDRLKANYNIDFSCIKENNINEFIEQFHEVYNASFSAAGRVNMLSKDDMHLVFENYKAFIKEKLVWVLKINQKPAGIIAFIPDQNNLFLKMFKASQLPVERVKGFVFAVKPEFRKIGAEVALALQLYKGIKEEYKEAEVYFSGISSATRSMLSFSETLGAEVSRVHKTYIYDI